MKHGWSQPVKKVWSKTQHRRRNPLAAYWDGEEKPGPKPLAKRNAGVDDVGRRKHPKPKSPPMICRASWTNSENYKHSVLFLTDDAELSCNIILTSDIYWKPPPFGESVPCPKTRLGGWKCAKAWASTCAMW